MEVEGSTLDGSKDLSKCHYGCVYSLKMTSGRFSSLQTLFLLHMLSIHHWIKGTNIYITSNWRNMTLGNASRLCRGALPNGVSCFIHRKHNVVEGSPSKSYPQDVQRYSIPDRWLPSRSMLAEPNLRFSGEGGISPPASLSISIILFIAH